MWWVILGGWTLGILTAFVLALILAWFIGDGKRVGTHVDALTYAGALGGRKGVRFLHRWHTKHMRASDVLEFWQWYTAREQTAGREPKLRWLEGYES